MWVLDLVAEVDLLEAIEDLGAQPPIDLGVAVVEAYVEEGKVAGGAQVVGEDLGDQDDSLPLLAVEATVGI
jgi:hypothetical protein